MTTLNITLPDALKSHIDVQMARGRYKSVSAYVRALIRADARRRAKAELEAQLLEGLKGKFTPMTSNDWERLRAVARNARPQARKR